ncbi:MAG: hypothetical protein IAC29_01910 [Bacteroidetes bacterium]|uniref:Organic solvent tolerance-like N-terminal domain-containing protein n=1 Tax=Candidatus Cryptobacteroides merdigallinarum TaxID=2840770 RepID=A0A9D9EK12_9BACT|nr:hypothetical protein [Candidatus Cryptobacteroides merdigallinarum]
MRRFLTFALMMLMPALTALAGLSAQEKEEQEDSLVRLLSGKSAQLLEINGMSYRKITGPARFFHNNTYLLCDTALWNVDTRVIDAIGNVHIIQDQTELQSEKMKYYIDTNLAEFRGDVVQLQDKDRNTLRTKFLDYNTKDSVAVFFRGGSMKDKDGQIIESMDGTYDSKIRTFDFRTDVNMFTDSIFIKTNTLRYQSDNSLATFGSGTNAWKDDNMLSSESGWYDRGREQFFFCKNVHLMSSTQEAWCDSLYFNRNTSDIQMYGNVQMTDTTRNVYGLAGKLDYVDSISTVTLTRDPAVITVTETDGQRDTVYFGADTLVHYTRQMFEIDSLMIAEAATRKANLEIDPVSAFRRKAAEEAAKKAAEAAENDPNMKAKMEAERRAAEKAAADSLAALKPADSLVVQDSLTGEGLLSPADSIPAGDTAALPDSLAVPDSLAAQDSLPGLQAADSLALADTVPALDTTKIGFVVALRNVKIYKNDMQVVCDSLLYSDLDSLARLFKEPVIWNDITQQYNADSIYAVIRNNTMEKASLMSNSFIHIQEDTAHYNQIRGAEMMAYFAGEGTLSRFDALGGASALFYIEENGELATVNKKDSKMLSAIFKDGELHRIYYFDTAVSDAYPVVQMTEEDRKLKGFSWTPERRPEDRHAVTSLDLRPSERTRYNARPRARYTQTNLYFPGYIDDIYLQISIRDSLNHVREVERQRLEREEELRQQQIKDSIAIARLDSLETAKADSLALQDSLKAVSDSLAIADSLAKADSIAALNDPSRVLTKEQLREKKKAEKEKKHKERIAARDARWAEKDKADADRENAKAERKAEKLREKKRRALRQAQDRARKDAAVLERYIEKYQRRQARKKT